MTQLISQSQRIVIKIGSNLIADKSNSMINTDWMQTLCDDIATLTKQGKEVVIVSSGAVALGRKFIKTNSNELKIEQKQAAAACGQPELVALYRSLFKAHAVNVAQVLITLFDSETRRNYLNVRNTLNTLLDQGIVPIVNENDTVATHEIRFGDNDRLAARIAQMVSADLLILFSDIDGIYTQDPRISHHAKHLGHITEITKEIEEMATGPLGDSHGSGGMITKIEAAKIATASGTHMIIAKGTGEHPLRTLIDGGLHTEFTSSSTPLSARKGWIATSLKTHGKLHLDDGAIKAVISGASLLPVGVHSFEGTFDRGDMVSIMSPSNKEIGRGLIAYSSEDMTMICGQHSSEISHFVGFLGREELIHRDDMVIF